MKKDNNNKDDLKYRKAAKEFIERWTNKGYEKGESQKFWIDLLKNVLFISNVNDFIEFETVAKIDESHGFIDAYIPSTKVLIEQKSISRDLREEIKQFDGSFLTPFQQAKRYIVDLPLSKHPRWVVACNFKSFLIYDMNKPQDQPEEIFLKDLIDEYYRLFFLISNENIHLKKETEVSVKASELIGVLYKLFLEQYNNPEDEKTLESLNVLCVRLVFCLYAEDAGIFGRKNMFHDYLNSFDETNIRTALIRLFKILNTKEEDRDPYLEENLSQFPYINGGLFDGDIEIPRFTKEIKKVLLSDVADDFNWAEISPTIFGSTFESTLNSAARRSGGMHYTSVENIHKIIDPLFLDDLKAELEVIKKSKQVNVRIEKLEKFQEKLSKIVIFDPAAGSR